jgi:peroxiredoxin
MVAVNSTMVPLGSPAPDFELPDATGRTWSLRQFGDAPVLVVAFVCNHCPYVKHIGPRLGELGHRWTDQGVAVVAVNSNDADAYPDDAPPRMVEAAETWDWRFPYLVDADQSVATAYRAACTPDFYVFDGDRRLVYRGRFDESRPSTSTPVTGADLDAAVAAALSGEPTAPEDQWPSIGCNIKWRPGNEPDWFG